MTLLICEFIAYSGYTYKPTTLLNEKKKVLHVLYLSLIFSALRLVISFRDRPLLYPFPSMGGW
jgi:hypothetical protein